MNHINTIFNYVLYFFIHIFNYIKIKFDLHSIFKFILHNLYTNTLHTHNTASSSRISSVASSSDNEESKIY
jgi:hypothetical protein